MALAALIVSGTVFAVYAARVFYTKTEGVMLKPSRDYEIHDTLYYLQNDPEWSGDAMGESGRALGGAGCLVSCISSAAAEIGVPVTPKEVNAKLGAIGGYQGAEVIWYKINEAFPEIDYRYSRVFTGKTIEKDLANGLLPIVNVKYKGSGITHWVLIVGAKDGEFLAADPLNQDKAPIGLSSTHGKAYAYRVLVPSTRQSEG